MAGRENTRECIVCHPTCSDCRSSKENGCIKCVDTSHRLILTESGNSGKCVFVRTRLGASHIAAFVVACLVAAGVIVVMFVFMILPFRNLHAPKEPSEREEELENT